MTFEADIKHLPPRTRELARLIGLGPLRDLCRWKGGVTIYIPSRERLRRSHPLARRLGWEAAWALAEDEGRRLEVPIMDQGATPVLHRAIREYRRTHSEAETARHFRITVRWVRLVCGRQEPDPGENPQSDLFGGT